MSSHLKEKTSIKKQEEKTLDSNLRSTLQLSIRCGRDQSVCKIISSETLSKVRSFLKQCLFKLIALFLSSFTLGLLFADAKQLFFTSESNTVSSYNDNLSDGSFNTCSDTIMSFLLDDETEEGLFSFAVAAGKNPDFNNYRNKNNFIFSNDDSDPSPAINKNRDLTNRELVNMLKTFSLSSTQGAPLFNGEGVTDFLNTYEKLCATHLISEKDKIKRLHRYCISDTEQYVRIILIDEDIAGKKMRRILRRKFKESNFAQQIVTLTYLKVLKNIKRIEFNEMKKYIRKYTAAFNLLLQKKKIQLRMQSRGFVQRLFDDFALNLAKRLDYDDDDDEVIFFETLKKIAGKLFKSLKTFKKTRNSNAQSTAIKQLVKDVENSNNLKKFALKKGESAKKVSFVDSRIDTMTKAIKKMTINVNTFMQRIAQQREATVRYSSYPPSATVPQQILSRFPDDSQPTQPSEMSVNSIQDNNPSFQPQQSRPANSQSVLYSNNQPMNPKTYQRYPSQAIYDRFFLDKCLYCYRYDHLRKRECKNYNNDLTSDRIHNYDKKIYLKPSKNNAPRVSMGHDRSQRDCVLAQERFNDITYSASQSVTIAVSSVFNPSTSASIVGNINSIIIRSDIIEKLSSDEEEKGRSKVVTLDHNNLDVTALFAIAAQSVDKKTSKTIKEIEKRVLNKKIEKEKRLLTFKTLRPEQWKSVEKDKMPIVKEERSEEEILMPDAPPVKKEKEKQKIVIIVPPFDTRFKRLFEPKIIIGPVLDLEIALVDPTVSSKMRKRASSRSKMIDIGKSFDDNDELIQKIRNTQVMLTLEELIAGAPAAHKLFIKGLTKEQIIKLQTRNLGFNMNANETELGYSCVSFHVWVFLKGSIEAKILLNSDAKINFMSAEVQKRLKFKMHALFNNIRIASQIDHVLQLLGVCSHVKIRIRELVILHHFFVVDCSDHFFVFDQFFCVAVSFNYNYRLDEIYVICFNPQFIRSVIVKIVDHHDKINKDREKMYDYSTHLKC